jgi:purine-nucleoside phosphorylase
MNMPKNNVKRAADYIRNLFSEKPNIGLILGSGLGVLADEIKNPVAIPYRDIPNFPVSTVEGHAGELVLGELSGQPVVAMKGRFHYYEGYTFDQVTFPVRVMKELGVDTLIVTNAAGGVNESFTPGDLMIIEDHINNMGSNPLIGANEPEWGPRFPDLSEAYTRSLQDLAVKTAKEIGLTVQRGIYFGNTGPSYETPAEIRMIRLLGGDAVGMSTVPEVIIANHAKMDVLGISCISNMAAGILDQPLDHSEVMETTEKVKVQFLQFVKEIVKLLNKKR